MSYCENFKPLNSRYPVTTITIPPDQVRRMELRVMQLIVQFNGKPMGVGLGSGDGSLVYQAVFFDDATRQQFCDTVNKEIDSGRPIIINKLDGQNGEDYEVKINIKFMLAKFHSIMGDLQPLFSYIEANGGWATSEENFPGADALDNAIRTETLSPEILEAVSAFGSFMGAYYLGSASLTGPATISHRDIVP